MAYVVKKRIELDSIGPDWKGAYLEFLSPSVNDIQKLTQQEDQAKAGIDLMSDSFAGGKAFDGEKLVDVPKEDFGKLPYDVLEFANSIFSGKTSPN